MEWGRKGWCKQWYRGREGSQESEKERQTGKQAAQPYPFPSLVQLCQKVVHCIQWEALELKFPFPSVSFLLYNGSPQSGSLWVLLVQVLGEKGAGRLLVEEIGSGTCEQLLLSSVPSCLPSNCSSIWPTPWWFIPWASLSTPWAVLGCSWSFWLFVGKLT